MYRTAYTRLHRECMSSIGRRFVIISASFFAALKRKKKEEEEKFCTLLHIALSGVNSYEEVYMYVPSLSLKTVQLLVSSFRAQAFRFALLQLTRTQSFLREFAEGRWLVKRPSSASVWRKALLYIVFARIPCITGSRGKCLLSKQSKNTAKRRNQERIRITKRWLNDTLGLPLHYKDIN